MERLCDEVLQLIFYELADPNSLTQVSKRYQRFSQDPYVRAHYFLHRYGHTQALFYALGRGKILTERVLDILLSSGAHLSRYIVQISIHHFFFSQAHFIKTAWVRNVPFRVFVYFLKLAEERYGEIPRGKGEDDGTMFSTFLKENRFPPQMKSVGWEDVRDILEKYRFIPFCNKDPIMAQFPLALSIEPRLLPYAVSNGFHMDSKYRDFVFRKMFERPLPSSPMPSSDIVQNVRELCRLDPTQVMFVSRTVAAEVCMEGKLNEAGYTALKRLDQEGLLRFDLSILVEDLFKTFLRTRSVTSPSTIEILRFLYADFPSADPIVRLVVLVTIFTSPETMNCTTLHAKLEALGLTPISRKDVLDILVNPFVERFHALMDYARREATSKNESTKGLGNAEIQELIEEAASRCLEVACKGKLLKKLVDGHPWLLPPLTKRILEKYKITLEQLPDWRDGPTRYSAKLSRDFMKYGLEDVSLDDSLILPMGEEMAHSEVHDLPSTRAAPLDDVDMVTEALDDMDLGHITQESLSVMIRHDEVTPARSRRRMYYPFGTFGDMSGKLPYPHDSLHVGKWVKSQFGAKSLVTAIFMTHAVINDNSQMLHLYLVYGDAAIGLPGHVPVTFKHFQILAKLGRAPNFYIYHDIENGDEFYLDEDEYVRKEHTTRGSHGGNHRVRVKAETSTGGIPSTSKSASTARSTISSRSRRAKMAAAATLAPSTSSGVNLSSNLNTGAGSTTRGRKRPRRQAAATVRSYAIPDSDDDTIIDQDDEVDEEPSVEKKTQNADTNLQKWLKALGELLKEEQKKFKEHKKQLEMNHEPGTKLRVPKNEFLKSLSTHLRRLRKTEEEKRQKLYGPEVPIEEVSDDDDDEYLHHKTRGKRRRVARNV